MSLNWPLTVEDDLESQTYVIFINERARKTPRNIVVYIVGAFSCLPPKTPFGGFKRPKGVRGTSGRSVNIDFRFLRIFWRIEALIRNWFQGGAR